MISVISLLGNKLDQNENIYDWRTIGSRLNGICYHCEIVEVSYQAMGRYQRYQTYLMLPKFYDFYKRNTGSA